MRKLFTLFAAALCCLAAGCTDAEYSQMTALGDEHVVTLYGATGEPVRQWISSGIVHAETQTDGWYFSDKATGHLIRVSGPVVIETK